MPVDVSTIEDQKPSAVATPPAPSPINQDKIKAIYDAVGQKYDLGDPETFKTKMQSPEKRLALYKAVGHEYDLGETFDEFEKKLQPASGSGVSVGQLREANDKAAHDPISGIGYQTLSEVDPAFAAQKKSLQDEADKRLLDVSSDWNQDPRNVQKVVSDFPWQTSDEALKASAEMLKDNPVGYERFRAADENINGLLRKVSPEDAHRYNQLQDASDINQLELNMAEQRAIINKDLTGDERAKALKNLEINRAPFFNGVDPNLQPPEAGTKNDMAGQLDNYQYAGLRHLQNFDPGKFDLYSRLLKTPADKSESVEQKIGREKIKQDLLNIGRKNTIDYLQEQQANLAKKWDESKDPEEKVSIANQFVKNKSSLEYTISDADSDKTKFPYLNDLEFDRQAKELYGKADQGVIGYALAKLGKGVGKAVSATTNLVSDIAGGEEKNLNELQSLGESEADRNALFLPEKYRPTGSPYVYHFDKSLQDAADKIKSDKSISDDQKLERITQLIKDNQGAVHTVTNPEYGKSKNFFSKATLYQNAGMIGDIAGIAAQQAGMEGAGLPRLLSSTIPMYLTSQSDYYKEALENGNPNPTQYATLHAGIMMAAGLINPDFNIAKRTFGIKTSIGAAMENGTITEELWNKVIKADKPLLAKIKNSAIGVAKEGAKISAVYGAGTSLASDLANKGLFNSQMTPEEIMQHAVDATRDMALSSVGLLSLHGIMNAKTASPQEKAHIWDLGDNPKIAIEKIDNMVSAGNLTTDLGEQRKQIIKNISKLVDRVPKEDVHGEPISDQRRADMLYNLVIKDKIGQMTKDLPESYGEKLKNISDGLDVENGEVIDPHSAKGAVAGLLSNIKFPDNSPWKAQEGNGAGLLKAIQQQATGHEQATGNVSSPEGLGSLLKYVPGTLIENAIRVLPEEAKIHILDEYKKQGIEVPDQVTRSLRPAMHMQTEDSEPAMQPTAPSKPFPVFKQIAPESGYLVSRHSDTIHDEQGIVSGPNQKELSKAGKRDANSLATDVIDKVKTTGVKITKIIHSGLERSAETAKTVAGKIRRGKTFKYGNPEMVEDKDLNTWDIGEFDGIKDTDFKKIQKWFVEHPNEKMYGGDDEVGNNKDGSGKMLKESFNDYAHRVITSHLKYENEGPSTLMVDHSNNMMVMDAYRKNGGIWDDKAAADYLSSEKPEPATLQEKKSGLSSEAPAEDGGKAEFEKNIKELNDRREEEISRVKKPEIPKLLSEKQYARLSVDDQLKHDELEKRVIEYKNLIDCLWKQQ